MIESGVISQPAVILYRRSSAQVALLTFASLGLYVFAWSYFMRRSIATIIEQPDQPVWKTVALVVPIFNFFLLFELGKKIQGVEWRADPQRVSAALPWYGLVFFALTVLSHVSSEYSYLGILAFAAIGLMHQPFSRAQTALIGDEALPTGFHAVEGLVLALGCIFRALELLVGFFGRSANLTGPDHAWLVGSLLASVAVLFAFRASSRRAIAEGRAMYAAPSPERIPAGG